MRNEAELKAAVTVLSFYMERAMGIEPTSRAWEARILPMNYARVVCGIGEAPIHSRLRHPSYHF